MFPVTSTHGSYFDLFSLPQGGLRASKADREASHLNLLSLLQDTDVQTTLARASSDLPPDSLANQA